MLRIILIYGAIGGLIVGGPMLIEMVLWSGEPMRRGGLILGYATMLVALSTVFLGVKRYRDKARGGVIHFLPALLVGLGISLVAGIFYVAAWDLSLAITHVDYIGAYAKSAVAAEKAKGVSEADLQAFSLQMNKMAADYQRPLYRWAVTFVEIFPVGVLISLISAGLLRNSRFMPARQG